VLVLVLVLVLVHMLACGFCLLLRLRGCSCCLGHGDDPCWGRHLTV